MLSLRVALRITVFIAQLTILNHAVNYNGRIDGSYLTLHIHPKSDNDGVWSFWGEKLGRLYPKEKHERVPFVGFSMD